MDLCVNCSKISQLLLALHDVGILSGRSDRMQHTSMQSNQVTNLLSYQMTSFSTFMVKIVSIMLSKRSYRI
jgi:hypothetical protein